MSRRQIAAVVVSCGLLVAYLVWPAGAPPVPSGPRGSSSAGPGAASSSRAAAAPGARSGPAAIVRHRRMRARPADAGAARDLLGGMTEQELLDRGMTPFKLFASRQGARWTMLSMLAERTGHDGLAERARGIGERLWRAHADLDDAEEDELLSMQTELIEEFALLTDSEDEELVAMFHWADAELSLALQGVSPSVEDKIRADEGDLEGPREEADEEGKAGADPDEPHQQPD